MFDGLWDWLGDPIHVTMLFLIIIIPSSLFMLLSNKQSMAAPEAVETTVFVELPEPKPIFQRVLWVYDNQNVTYFPTVFSITNEQNYTVQLLINFFSEPEALMDYVVFSTSGENGTVIQPGESLALSVSVITFTNPSNMTGDYYLKVYGEPL